VLFPIPGSPPSSVTEPPKAAARAPGPAPRCPSTAARLRWCPPLHRRGPGQSACSHSGGTPRATATTSSSRRAPAAPRGSARPGRPGAWAAQSVHEASACFVSYRHRTPDPGTSGTRLRWSGMACSADGLSWGSTGRRGYGDGRPGEGRTAVVRVRDGRFQGDVERRVEILGTDGRVRSGCGSAPPVSRRRAPPTPRVLMPVPGRRPVRATIDPPVDP
jgi:hypothetical protein